MSDPLRPTVSEVDGQIQVDASPSAAPVDNHDYTEIMGFLGLDAPNDGEVDKLKAITDYLKKEVKSGLKSEWLMTLRHYEQRLSTPKLGETRLGKLYNYIKAQELVKESERQRDALLA